MQYNIFHVISIILALPSLLLNMLVLYSIYLRRHSGWAIDALLMFLVGILDSICALYVLVIQSSHYFASTDLLENNSTWCTVSAIVCSATILSAILVTSLLSFVRYLAIVRGNSLKTSFWLSLALFIVLLVWGSLGGLVYWYVPKTMPAGLYCFPLNFEVYEHDMLKFVVSLLVVLVLCLGTIAICYASISIYLRRLLICLPSPRHVLFKLVAILVSYTVTLIPELVLLFKEAISKTPRNVNEDAIATFFLFSITIVNALFVLTLHHETRQECRKIFASRHLFHSHHSRVSSDQFYHSDRRDRFNSTKSYQQTCL